MFLDDILVGGVWVFLMTFARVGATIMIMPGTGDNFMPVQIRLMFALSFSLIVTPLVLEYLPAQPESSVAMIMILGKEILIGLFFGLIARIMMIILDVAGMMISFQSAMANAQVFNPQLATQGSIMGAFLSMTGMVLFFALGLHQIMLAGIIKSYEMLPAADWYFPAEDFARAMAGYFASAFIIAIQLTMPLMVIVLMLYAAMGILGRLMPQLQIFIFLIPIQVSIALFIMITSLHVIMTVWGQYFMDVISAMFGGINVR